MFDSAAFRLSKSQIRAAGLIVLASALIAVGVAGAAGASAKRVVSEAENSALGKTVLTTTKGRTLYSLSVEKNGKFICTGACLSTWHPLTVPAGTKPTGPVKLGTIERPEGGIQVTYRGRPLYRFGPDSKAGEANGEGIKDVGTWHAATASKAQPAPKPQPPAESPPPYQPPY
jgi:predicted lipoprotein with Yx(FWY)xxD motif